MSLYFPTELGDRDEISISLRLLVLGVQCTNTNKDLLLIIIIITIVYSLIVYGAVICYCVLSSNSSSMFHL